MRETAGLIDATAFTKHIVRGPGATAFLDWFTCNKLPAVGRINLTYALTPTGTTRTEYTIVRNGPDDYYLVSAGAWTAYDADYLRKCAEDKAPEFGHIDIHDVTTQWGVFAIAGPNTPDSARDRSRTRTPKPFCRTSVSRGCRRARSNLACARCTRSAWPIPANLGWELHHPIEMQRYLWDLLLAAGEKHGMKLVGARAQNWLRQEKSYRAFGTELGRDATPLEAGLDRFVDLSKDFQGKQAMLDTGIRVEMRDGADRRPGGYRPLGQRGAVVDGVKVGRLTSGGYSVGFGKQIGMGYVRPDLAEVGHQAEGQDAACRNGMRWWSKTARLIRRMRVSGWMADIACDQPKNFRTKILGPRPCTCHCARAASQFCQAALDPAKALISVVPAIPGTTPGAGVLPEAPALTRVNLGRVARDRAQPEFGAGSRPHLDCRGRNRPWCR